MTAGSWPAVETVREALTRGNWLAAVINKDPLDELARLEAALDVAEQSLTHFGHRPVDTDARLRLREALARVREPAA